MQVAPGVYAIGAVGSVVYLLGGVELTLVDAGGPGTTPRVVRQLERLEREPHDLTRVLLTHADLDHVGDLPALVEATGARVYADPLTFERLGAGNVPRGDRGLGSAWALVRGLFSRPRRVEMAAEPLSDGLQLPILGGLRVIFTGGHSPDHVAYFLEQSRLVLAGDLLEARGGHLQAFPGPEQPRARRLSSPCAGWPGWTRWASCPATAPSIATTWPCAWCARLRSWKSRVKHRGGSSRESPRCFTHAEETDDMTDALRAVIWDVDGVLVVSGDIHYEAWRQVLGEQGLAMSREQFDATFGMNNRNILRHLYGEGLSDGQVAEISRRKEAAYRERMRGRVQPLPGVREWLERLHDGGWRQAVASSGPMANIAATLNEFDLWDAFDAVVSGARLARSKPDPAIFLQAAAAAGVAPERCVAIEDGIVGVEAAQRSGMRTIAVTTTHTAAELRAADRIVGRLDHLPPDTFDLLVPAGRS